MSTEKMNLDDVRQIMLSLLLARKGATAVPVLDSDYYQEEKKRIPYRQFGYVNLVEFLRSMPEHFVIQFHNGVHYVRGIASERSKHVSSLVSRQKQNIMKYPPLHFQNRYPLNYSVPRMQHIRRIPAEQLNILVQYVKDYPNGVSMQTAMLMMQKQLPHVVLSMHDLQQQLHELTHQIYMDGEIIRPVKSKNNDDCRKITNHQPLLSQEDVARSTAEVTYGIPGDESDVANFNHNGDSIPVNFVDHDIKGSKEVEQLKTNFNREQMFYHHDSDDMDECIADTEKSEHSERNSMSRLINERTRLRLEKLMRKHPDGIWCTELPQKYLEEYKVPLNYSNLGFNSVRQYVACLPEIFYMKQHISKDDFILFSTDMRLKDQDQLAKSYIRESPSKNVHETTPTTEPDVRDLYNLHDVDDDNIAPFPSDVNVSVFEKFAPKGAMAYDQSVGQILVTDLNCARKKFLESYVVEVFTPSFFWIHLRQHTKYLTALMDDLGEFYKQNSETYAIPKLALKRGLNCACLYDNVWHRGIIKTVKPDFRVTVMCYDYGTLKTYAPEEVYYLHEKFSYLPAQAIPCGLYNIRPNVGDRWKKSITNRFVERVFERLLAATIISIDPTNNSMLIVLTDTSEENDVHINDWLLQENLARHGKMVRMLSGENFSFQHYMSCNSTTSRFYKTTEAKNAIVTDVDRRDKDQSMLLCDSRTRKSFYVESEDVRKNVEALHNVPIGKEAMQICNIKPITEIDSKLNKKNRGPKELVMLLEKLKTLNPVSSDFGTDTFSSKGISNFGNNTQRKDLESVVNIKSQSNDNLLNYNDSNEESVKRFNVVDSDNEKESENYFGTFQSMCGGHGMMEPFDWSVIRKNDNYRTTTSYNIISNSVIVEEYSNKTKDKSNENVHNPENKTAASSYFLTFLLREDAYYLVENNIDYDIRNVSQSVTKLKTRMKMYNDKHTALVVKKKTLEALRSSVWSRDIPNPDTDIIESDGTSSSSKEIVSREAVNEVSIDGNSEVYKTNQEKFERDLNTNVEAYSNGNDNDNHKNIDIPEYTKSSEINVSKDKVHNRRFRTLLEHMKRLQSLDSSFDSTKESTNNERFQSSDSNNRSSTDETMISSDDDQNETYSRKNGMVRFNKLLNFTAKSTSPTLISSSDKLDNDSEARVLLREDDNAFSTNIVDSRPYQLNKIDESHTSKALLQVLKMQQNMVSVNELDSDDLSSQESNDDRSTKNDESNNEPADRDASDVACNFINNDDCKNMFDEKITAPVFNDCDTDYNECDDIEFDGCRWDIYATPEHFSFQPNSLPNSEVQIVEISDNESESEGNVS